MLRVSLPRSGGADRHQGALLLQSRAVFPRGGHRQHTENKNKALNTTDPAEAATLWKAVADELYFEVYTMPLFTLPVQAIIDPEIISEYIFLGPPGGSYNNFENIKGVRK